jgi:hypothetical protein
MRIGLVTGNSEQVSQGTEKTLTCVITYQMTPAKKDNNLASRKEQIS